jgi:hypothetical protein
VNVLPVACHQWNVCEAVSAKMLRTPAIDHVISDDACFVCRCIARAQTSLAATMDLDELNLFAQLMVGVLYHQAAVGKL